MARTGKRQMMEVLAGAIGMDMAFARAVFDKCEAVDQELAAAGIEKMAPMARAVFSSARPSPVFWVTHGMEAYRHHVRELIARAKAGQDLRPGTTAECLLALSESSLKAPLSEGATALMEKLFADVYPELSKQITTGSPPREPWPGFYEETLATMRKGLTQAYRGAR